MSDIKMKNNHFRLAWERNLRTWKIWWKLCPKFFVSCTSYSVLKALSPYVTIWLSAQIINELAGSKNPERLFQLVLIQLVSAALLALCTGMLNRWFNCETDSMRRKYDRIWMEKMMKLDYTDIDRQYVYELYSQVKQNENWAAWGFYKSTDIFQKMVLAILRIFGGIALSVSLFVLPVPAGSGALTLLNHPLCALLMFVFCWTLYMFDPAPFVQLMHAGNASEWTGNITEFVNKLIIEHLGDTATTLFFLMGAMTIVEIVDQNGGFNWVKNVMRTKSKRALLWRIACMTFILSAILDNLTTSIVMIMILRKLISNKEDRMVYAALVIISANSGGAFSPIGDVTTIMLWNAGTITAAGVISEIFIPSVVSMVIPAFIMQYMLKGELAIAAQSETEATELGEFGSKQRKTVFIVGVGGLCFVPIFKSITHLPPFVGIMLVLGVLWTVTELFYRHLHRTKGDGVSFAKRVTNLLSRIDISTILFFLGILMAVACLQEIGVLMNLGKSLNTIFDENHYAVTGIIGVLSSIVDNVPLVAGSMGMYPIQAAGDMAVDGIFWQLLAYCAGVGGSMLIIGSAAGVIVMGLEKITFGWYMKKITWIAFVGYLAGILSYYIVRTYIFTTPL